MFTLLPLVFPFVLAMSFPVETATSVGQGPRPAVNQDESAPAQSELFQRGELAQYEQWLESLHGPVLPSDAGEVRRAEVRGWYQRLWVAADLDPETALGIECRVQLVALLNECGLHADSELHIRKLIALDKGHTMRSFWKAELSEVRLLRLSSADRKNVDLRESLAIHEEARVALESEARAASGAALMDASLRMRYLGVLLGYSDYAAHGAVDLRTACDRLKEGYTFSRACAAANLDLVGRTPEHFARVHFDLLLMDSSASPETLEQGLANLRGQDKDPESIAMRFGNFLERRYGPRSPEFVSRARQFLKDQGEDLGIQALILQVKVATLLMHGGDHLEAMRLAEPLLGSVPTEVAASNPTAWKALRLVGGLVYAASAQLAGDELSRAVAIHHLVGLKEVGFESEADIALRVRDLLAQRPR